MLLSFLFTVFFSVPQDAEELVGRLWSDDLKERREAVDLLIRKGREVFPVLKKALDSGNPEARSRAEEVAFALGIDPVTRRPGKNCGRTTRRRPMKRPGTGFWPSGDTFPGLF